MTRRKCRNHWSAFKAKVAMAAIRADKTLAGAKRYLAEVCMPAYNAEFMQPAAEAGSGFVPLIGQPVDDVLCEHYERAVGRDNCVSFEGLKLQIPAERHRMHYIKVRVRLHRHPHGRLALFHGPRGLVDYDAQGQLTQPQPTTAAA